jgi:hypothetical protein
VTQLLAHDGEDVAQDGALVAHAGAVAQDGALVAHAGAVAQDGALVAQVGAAVAHDGVDADEEMAQGTSAASTPRTPATTAATGTLKKRITNPPEVT